MIERAFASPPTRAELHADHFGRPVSIDLGEITRRSHALIQAEIDVELGGETGVVDQVARGEGLLHRVDGRHFTDHCYLADHVIVICRRAVEVEQDGHSHARELLESALAHFTGRRLHAHATIEAADMPLERVERRDRALARRRTSRRPELTDREHVVAQLAIEERHLDEGGRKTVGGRIREEARDSTPCGQRAFAFCDGLEALDGVADRVNDFLDARVPMEGFGLRVHLTEPDGAVFDPQKEPRTLFVELLAREHGVLERDALTKQASIHDHQTMDTATVVAAARMAELADAEASKAFTREGVWVRVPLRALLAWRPCQT